jgi:hypothetical protein
VDDWPVLASEPSRSTVSLKTLSAGGGRLHAVSESGARHTSSQRHKLHLKKQRF